MVCFQLQFHSKICIDDEMRKKGERRRKREKESERTRVGKVRGHEERITIGEERTVNCC